MRMGTPYKLDQTLLPARACVGLQSNAHLVGERIFARGLGAPAQTLMRCALRDPM